MFDYKIALLLCLLIMLIPILIFYVLRHSIRLRVIKKIATDKVIKFPSILLVFILGELISLGIGGACLFSVLSPNFDLGLVKKIVIKLDSKPSNGALIVNGRYYGRTPTEILFKKPGKYVVRIDSISGYLPAETLIVFNNISQSQYEIELKRAPIGKITLRSPFSVYEKPDKGSSLITTISIEGNYELALLARKNNWVEVRLYDGKEGWALLPKDTAVSPPILSSSMPKPTKYVTITTSTAKIRAEPSLGSKPIAEISQNTKLPVIAYKEGWYKVSLPNGKVGWVYRTFVSE